MLNLYPGITYQTFGGLGAALTEAAAYTFLQADKAMQDQILAETFGAGYTALRLAVDSCDFSLGKTTRPWRTKTTADSPPSA